MSSSIWGLLELVGSKSTCRGPGADIEAFRTGQGQRTLRREFAIVLADAAELIVAGHGDGAGQAKLGARPERKQGRQRCTRPARLDSAQKQFRQIFHLKSSLLPGAKRAGSGGSPDRDHSSVSAPQSQYGDLSFWPRFGGKRRDLGRRCCDATGCCLIIRRQGLNARQNAQKLRVSEYRRRPVNLCPDHRERTQFAPDISPFLAMRILLIRHGQPHIALAPRTNHAGFAGLYFRL